MLLVLRLLLGLGESAGFPVRVENTGRDRCRAKGLGTANGIVALGVYVGPGGGHAASAAC